MPRIRPSSHIVQKSRTQRLIQRWDTLNNSWFHFSRVVVALCWPLAVDGHAPTLVRTLGVQRNDQKGNAIVTLESSLVLTVYRSLYQRSHKSHPTVAETWCWWWYRWWKFGGSCPAGHGVQFCHKPMGNIALEIKSECLRRVFNYGWTKLKPGS